MFFFLSFFALVKNKPHFLLERKVRQLFYNKLINMEKNP